VAKTEERELRDLLETAQSKVRRLEAELAAREKAEPIVVPQVDAKEVRALQEQVRALEQENSAIRLERNEAQVKLAVLRTELGQTQREATQTRDEVKLLKKQLEAANQALAKSKARVQQLSTQPASQRSLLDRVRGLFGGGKSQELEAAHKEIARLNQQLSLAQFNRRRGR
jgi:chromosome segregation ATPase